VPLRSALGAFAWDVCLIVALMIAFIVLLTLLWAMASGVRAAMQGGVAQPAGAVAQLALIVLASAGVAWLLYAFRRPATAGEKFHSRAMARRPRTWWLAAGVGAGMFLLITLATFASRQLGLVPDPSNQALIREIWQSHPLLLALFVVVLAPLYEEVLFRRVLFGRLWAQGWPVLGLWLSGLAFACAHELPSLGRHGLANSLLLMGLYTLLGVAFAWVYRRTGTLAAPIVAHGLNNALALGVMALSLNG